MFGKAMVIAGSDSCAGAGLQADIKTFSSFGVYTTTVVTFITAQNTTGIIKSSFIEPVIVCAQIDSIMTDVGSDAVKIGVIPSVECALAVVESLVRHKAGRIVLDPVLTATTGHVFAGKNVTNVILSKLYPLVDLVTPNISETERLSGVEVKTIEGLKEAIVKLWQTGTKNVLATGWTDGDSSVDVLYDGTKFHEFRAPIVRNANVHGAGCTFSSAIAANLALGLNMITAISNAKLYVTKAIHNSFSIGSGLKVLAHFQPVEKKK